MCGGGTDPSAHLIRFGLERVAGRWGRVLEGEIGTPKITRHLLPGEQVEPGDAGLLFNPLVAIDRSVRDLFGRDAQRDRATRLKHRASGAITALAEQRQGEAWSGVEDHREDEDDPQDRERDPAGGREAGATT